MYRNFPRTKALCILPTKNKDYCTYYLLLLFIRIILIMKLQLYKQQTGLHITGGHIKGLHENFMKRFSLLILYSLVIYIKEYW